MLALQENQASRQAETEEEEDKRLADADTSLAEEASSMHVCMPALRARFAYSN